MRLRERARHKSWTDSIYLSLYLRQCWYRGCHRDNAPWCSLAWYLSLRRAEGQDTRRSHAHVHSRPAAAAAAWYSKREDDTRLIYPCAHDTPKILTLCAHKHNSDAWYTHWLVSWRMDRKGKREYVHMLNLQTHATRKFTPVSRCVCFTIAVELRLREYKG